MKHISEDNLIWAGIWVILNHFVCSWGQAVIAWEPVPVACGELGWLCGYAGSVLSRATVALKPRQAASAPCWFSWSLPLDTEGYSHPEDQSTKWKAHCALLGLMWGRESWEGVFTLLDLWEQLPGKWVKAWGEIILLGLLCSSREGQMAFPSLGTGADCPELPHCSGSEIWGADFWGADGSQHLPEGGIHGFNFVGIHSSLHASCLGPNRCSLLGYRFAYEAQCFTCFPKTEDRKRMTDLYSLKTAKRWVSPVQTTPIAITQGKNLYSSNVLILGYKTKGLGSSPFMLLYELNITSLLRWMLFFPHCILFLHFCLV